ncbi:MAG: LacI family DNA-binding transcriptional regulator [Variibacter sp.]
MRKRSRTSEATIREVARVAGVSMMTVSNVLNGRFNQMSGKTRLSVEQAITNLNYRPHQMARNLRRSEHLSIGLLFIDDESTFITHPGHSYVMSGLSGLLNSRGYSLTLQGLDPKRLSDALPIKSFGTDALCIVQSGPRQRRLKIVRAISALSQPCVLIHETNAPPDGDFCCIREADESGGRMIAEHLIDRGCRSLLLLLPQTIWASMEARARGARAACRRRNVPVQEVRAATPKVEDAYRVLDEYLSAHELPDGILAGNDHLGIGALQFLSKEGISVPSRVRVTGFNAFEFWKYSDPLLTTVRTPAEQLGVRAGEELIQRLTTGRFSAPSIVLPVELVIGAST